MAKLRKGTLPFQPNLTVGPFVSPSSPSRRGHSDGGRIGLSPTLKHLQDVKQARGQLEGELAQETQELAQQYDDRWIKLARRHERWTAQMVKQADATFQEVFSPGKLGQLYQVTALVHLLHSSPPLHEWSTCHCHAAG